MEVKTYICPICGGECHIEDYSTLYDWHHECSEGLKIASGKMFSRKREAIENWGECCTLIRNMLDLEYSNGYIDGMRDS